MDWSVVEILGWRERIRGSERVCVKGKRKYLNNEIESYNNHVYMHDYSSKFRYLQSYRRTNACDFYVILCKFLHFLYFRPTDAIALNM